MDPTIPPTITKPFQTQSGQRTHHNDQSISLSLVCVQNYSLSRGQGSMDHFFEICPGIPSIEHFLVLATEKSQIRKGMKKQ